MHCRLFSGTILRCFIRRAIGICAAQCYTSTYCTAFVFNQSDQTCQFGYKHGLNCASPLMGPTVTVGFTYSGELQLLIKDSLLNNRRLVWCQVFFALVAKLCRVKWNFPLLSEQLTFEGIRGNWTGTIKCAPGSFIIGFMTQIDPCELIFCNGHYYWRTDL